MRHLRTVTLASMLLALACDGGTNPPPAGGGGGSQDTISGRERFAWRQTGPSTAELSIYRFALYIDNERRVVEGELCVPADATAIECSAALPGLGAGQHTLQLAAFYNVDGTTFEGPRSQALQVTVANALTSSVGFVVQGGAFESSDGVPLDAEILARNLVDPVDLAVAGDGRVFVAERANALRIIDPRGGDRPSVAARVTAEDSALRSIALAPDFDRSGLLFAAYLTSDRQRWALRVVRLREVNGQLGQAAMIGSFEVPAGDVAGLARFGPDARLHVAVGGDSASQDIALDAARPSSMAGKILRLRDDGTTPEDSVANSPVFSSGHRDPRGLAWLPRDRSLWEVERDERGDEINRIQRGADYGWPSARDRAAAPGVVAPAVTLDAGMAASGMTAVTATESAFFGDLIVAAEDGRDLLRYRVGADGRPRLAARLLGGRFGRIGQVAAGADGALYFVTGNAAEWGAGQDVLVRVRIQPHSPHNPRSQIR